MRNNEWGKLILFWGMLQNNEELSKKTAKELANITASIACSQLKTQQEQILNDCIKAIKKFSCAEIICAQWERKTKSKKLGYGAEICLDKFSIL